MTSNSKITPLFQQMLRRARETGEVRRVDLAHGARLVVQVGETHTKLTIARRNASVGDKEEVIFRRDCEVPSGARRIPATGQRTKRDGKDTWHLLGYMWPNEEEQHATEGDPLV